MFRLTFELPRRRWCDATGAVLLSLVTAVRSLVDFRQLKDITLSEHVRSNVECDVCKAYIKMNIHTYLAYITISPLKKKHHLWWYIWRRWSVSRTYARENGYLMEIYYVHHTLTHLIWMAIRNQYAKARVRQLRGKVPLIPLSSSHSHLMDCKHWILSVYSFSFFCHACFSPLSSRGRGSRKGNLLHKFLNYISFVQTMQCN